MAHNSNRHKHGVQKHAGQDESGGGGWVEGITALGESDAATRLMLDQKESAVASVLSSDPDGSSHALAGERQATANKDEDFEACLERSLALMVIEIVEVRVVWF